MTFAEPPARRRRSLGARLALGALAFVAPNVVSGGCVIPDRTFAATDCEAPNVLSDGQCVAAESLDGLNCDTYCRRVATQCVGTQAVYTSPEQCLAVCGELDLGTLGDTNVNTVACRMGVLGRQGFEESLCSAVGPLSNDQCGSNCEAFCALRRLACEAQDPTNLEFTRDGYCLQSCQQLKDSGTYLSDSYDEADTLQCRTGHLALALATTDVTELSTECKYSRIVPQTGDFRCQDSTAVLEAADDREIFCGLVQYSCTGALEVYRDDAECLRASETFVVGDVGDTSTNTLRCRRYHAYAAFEDPAQHCTHAGPTGDGHCFLPEQNAQGNCTSYCRILNEACAAGFAARFGQDLEACAADCTATLQDDGVDGFRDDGPRYSTDPNSPPPPPGTLKCRTLHAVRALAAPNGAECASALGGAECDPDLADPQ